MEEVPRHGFILSSKGGIVTDWQVEGKPILFPYQKMVIEKKVRWRGGMFFCFPNFGPVDKNFGLPQHGKLRTLKGTPQPTPPWGTESVNFDTTRLFGKELRRCKVVVSAESGSAKTDSRSLRYELWASLPRAGSMHPTSLCPGIHPYFATPEGVASVRIGASSYPVRGLIKEPRYYNWNGEASIMIPGIGIIDLSVSKSMLPRSTRIVLWRDSLQYLCVEPVYGEPENYGTPGCFFLRDGHSFGAHIELRLR